MMNLSDGRAVINLQKLKAYGGGISGRFVANGRSGSSVGGKLQVDKVQVQPIIEGLLGVNPLVGVANVQVEFLGVASSQSEIMQSLSARGTFSMKDGYLSGVDLDRGNREANSADAIPRKTTAFNSLKATFEMADGALTTKSLALVGSDFAARGSGEIDFGNQTLNYHFVPTLLEENVGEVGQSDIHIVQGPWASPKYIVRPTSARSEGHLNGGVAPENLE